MVRLKLSVSNVTYEVIGKTAAEYYKILNDTIIIIAKVISNLRQSWKIYVYAIFVVFTIYLGAYIMLYL